MGILENLILLFIAVVVGMILFGFHKTLGKKKSFNLIVGFLSLGAAIASAYLFFTKGEFVHLGVTVVSLITSVMLFWKAARLPK